MSTRILPFVATAMAAAAQTPPPRISRRLAWSSAALCGR